jgi:hypothetical protein
MCFHPLYIFGMHSSYDCSSWHLVDCSRHCQALLLESKSYVITTPSPITLAIDIIKFMKLSKFKLLDPGTRECAPPICGHNSHTVMIVLIDRYVDETESKVAGMVSQLIRTVCSEQAGSSRMEHMIEFQI